MRGVNHLVVPRSMQVIGIHPAETFPQRSFPGYTGLLATVDSLVQFPARNTRRRVKGERDIDALARDPERRGGGCVLFLTSMTRRNAGGLVCFRRDNDTEHSMRNSAPIRALSVVGDMLWLEA